MSQNAHLLTHTDAPASGLLRGRTAVVTGAAKGIGAAIARRFHTEGARVVVADIDPAGAELAAGLGEGARFQACDVSREGDVAALADTAMEAFEGLDVWVNNAGVGSDYDDPTEVTEDVMDRVHAINQKGTLFGIKHAARVMGARAQGGSIVNIASIAALSGGTSGLVYTGTKGAVVALTRSAALHLGDRAIRVNAIAPGIILTPIYEASYKPGVAETVLAHQSRTQQPLRQLGRGEDVAGPALFLASDLSRFVTGQTLAVDGGYSSSHRGAMEAGFAKLREVLAETTGDASGS